MKVDFFIRTALMPALELLPPKMSSPAAMAMVVAICLQESRLAHRRQIEGPARGYAQFELAGGVRGVVTHPLTRATLAHVCEQIDIPADTQSIYQAIEYHDILCCVMARLLLWTLPDALPNADQPNGAWNQYMAAWRPGKPHPDSWPVYFETAWREVAAATREV